MVSHRWFKKARKDSFIPERCPFRAVKTCKYYSVKKRK
jgi:hypothetical protein